MQQSVALVILDVGVGTLPQAAQRDRRREETEREGDGERRRRREKETEREEERRREKRKDGGFLGHPPLQLPCQCEFTTIVVVADESH